jgi:leader peptidase (prepilin peptidase) / N-methyltransferase
MSCAAVGNHALAALAALGCVTPAIVATDLRERRIPTRLVHGSAVILAIVVVLAVASGQPDRALHAAVGLVIVGGAFLAVHLVSPSGMGFGDVRLAALAGTAVAYGASAGAAIACAVAAAAASGMACLLRRQRSAPFATFIAPIALMLLAVHAIGR